MKKRLSIGLVLISLGLLYVTFWQIGWNQWNSVISGTTWHAIKSPDDLAEHLPVLNAIMWLLRYNVFDQSCEPSLLAYNISTELWVNIGRNVLLGLSAVLAGAAILLERKSKRVWRQRLLSGLKWLCVVGYLAMMLIVSVSLFTHKRRAPRWDRKQDSNILNRHGYFGDRNQDIILESASEGIILTETYMYDAHLEVDRKGWITIRGVPVSVRNLVALLERKAEQTEFIRIILWVDARCKAKDRDLIIQIAKKANAKEIYFVVRDDSKTGRPHAPYKALRYAGE